MKLLIAYDGSSCAESALDDLVRAGLPPEADALVLAVAEVWLTKNYSNENRYASSLTSNGRNYSRNGKNYQPIAKEHSESTTLAKHAAKRLQNYFPEWKIEAVSAVGSPAKEIIGKANEFEADLIVVGSHGRTNLGGRFILGSVSQNILTEAACPVRVARGRIETDPVPPTIVIAYDGSVGADRAVKTVATRQWREGSEFYLIAVGDQVAPAAIERFVPTIAHWVEDEIRTEREWLEKIAAPALEKLRAAGHAATLDICAGNPKQVIAREAARLHADSIFVGANSSGKTIGKFLLGSVSAAIAARAHCSVEVVR